MITQLKALKHVPFPFTCLFPRIIKRSRLSSGFPIRSRAADQCDYLYCPLLWFNMRPSIVVLWIVIIALSLWPSDSALVSPPEADLASCPRPKSIQCIKDKIKLARHFQKIRDTYLADVNRRYHLLHNLNLVTYKLRSTFRKKYSVLPVSFIFLKRYLSILCLEGLEKRTRPDQTTRYWSIYRPSARSWMPSINRGAMDTADGLQLPNWISSHSETMKPKLEFLTNQMPLYFLPIFSFSFSMVSQTRFIVWCLYEL